MTKSKAKARKAAPQWRITINDVVDHADGSATLTVTVSSSAVRAIVAEAVEAIFERFAA